MADITQILSKIEEGDPNAADQLLPIVYDELRKLAAAKMNLENPGNTLQATALVHEAFIRLTAGDGEAAWDGRGHFFAAAAEAMRRILINRAQIGSGSNAVETENALISRISRSPSIRRTKICSP